MFSYFVILAVIFALLLFGELTRKYGFKNLFIRREIENQFINEGEEFRVSIIIENKKWLPISFLLLKELIPKGLEFHGEDIYVADSNYNNHTSRYSIKWFERIKRTYSYKGLKRGTYLLKEIYIDLGDIFGFYSDENLIDSYVELLVYPKLANIKDLKLNTTSLYGDNVIRRWIYKDPLYIKGIREYNKEDRMSDIHWKSSLKMNKLMVKDYDYTSEFELVLIIDVQCADPYWRDISTSSVERGISTAAALAKQSIKEGVPVGLWTDAKLISYKTNTNSEIEPSLHSFKSIIETCARIDYSPKVAFSDYLLQRSKYFKTNCTYIIITSFLNEKSIGILSMLRRSGYSIKLIDISNESELPSISNIEKINFNKGGIR
ncbi:hypothetical protein HMPREF1982_00966 [Clostridiales bacterium oral taxon 876 str. F0540]|nr:hypothetical protein HMPREF1982_00966 [Clostridiales bacterium oral taxon 876 str. F0540]